MRSLIALGLPIVAFVFSGMAVRIGYRLHQYRIDIPPGMPVGSGAHWSWQGNVFKKENYSPDAHPLFQRMVRLNLAALITAIAWVVCVTMSFP